MNFVLTFPDGSRCNLGIGAGSSDRAHLVRMIQKGQTRDPVEFLAILDGRIVHGFGMIRHVINDERCRIDFKYWLDEES